MTGILEGRVWATAPALPGGGELSTDSEMLAQASTDLGRRDQRSPGAVLRPRSAEDVAAMTAWCHQHRIPVRACGTRRSTGGQSLVAAGGLQIDMRSLHTVHRLDDELVDVDAGALFLDLVTRGAEAGLRLRSGPPGYLRLTVGGVLSTGGLSTHSDEGAIIDRVRRVQVATPDGLRWCSRTQHPLLFHRVLGGLGRHGVITRAVLEMTAAPARARTWALPYIELSDLLADLRTVLAEGDTDECSVRWRHNPAGDRPVYQLLVSRYYSGIDQQPDAPVRARLRATDADMVDHDWIGHATDTTRRYDTLAAGCWTSSMKFGSCLLVPEGALDTAGAQLIAGIGARDLSPSSVALVLPHRRDRFRTGRLPLPAGSGEQHVYAVCVLSDALGQQDPCWAVGAQRRAADRGRLAAHAGVTVVTPPQ